MVSHTKSGLNRLHTMLRVIEYVCLGVFFITVFWLLFTSHCAGPICETQSFYESHFTTTIQIIFPLVGILNSVRILVAFELFDIEENDQDILFIISLLLMAISFGLFGIFYQQFLQRSELALISSPVLLLLIFNILFTITLILADKRTWDRTIPFVRYRISLSLTHLVLLILNPVIGLFASLIILPVQVLMFDGITKEMIEDKKSLEIG